MMNLKKVCGIFIALALVLGVVGCGNAGPKNTTSNKVINIDGIYVNEGYENDQGLKQVVVFLTVTADEKNLDLSSKTFELKINDANEYSAKVESDSPNMTEYYYSDIIKDVYVGESLKIAMTYEVPAGDLSGGKSIALDDFDNTAQGIKLSTDDLKKMSSLEEISKDIDSDYYAKRKSEEDKKMESMDDAAANGIRQKLNGYYWTFDTYVGTQYVKYELEFAAPNQFEVRSSLGLSNSGTYEVRNGYIVLTYSNGNSIKTAWSQESDGIHLTCPFYNNGADTIF